MLADIPVQEMVFAAGLVVSFGLGFISGLLSS